MVFERDGSSVLPNSVGDISRMSESGLGERPTVPSLPEGSRIWRASGEVLAWVVEERELDVVAAMEVTGLNEEK